MKLKEAYTILGIQPPSDSDTIRRAYLKRALLFHPDRNPSENATKMFQSISTAYDILKDEISITDKYKNYKKFEHNLEQTDIHAYKRMFEHIYTSYSESFTKWMDGPELRLLHAMYKQLKKKFQPKCETETSQTDAEETSKKNDVSHLDIVQTLVVNLEEIYKRNIKKVTVIRYRWCEETNSIKKNSYTVLVPIENSCVCFPDEGDSDKNGCGNLYFIITAKDDDACTTNKLYRDTTDRYTLRYKMHISPYDMCYGGGEYYISHYKEPIRLKIGAEYYKRCHIPVKVDGFGLWNPDQNQYDNMFIDILINTDKNHARKALFQSLYRITDSTDLNSNHVQTIMV